MIDLFSRLIQRQLDLPAPLTRKVAVEPDLRVPMRDGVDLLGDRWFPKDGPAGLPTVLIRTPYGRANMFGKALVRPLAERGFQVFIQSARGGFGSGGVMDALRQEREDGLDTLEWTLEQPWFGDAMVLSGASYLGFVQWAVADSLPPQVKAMIPVVTESALTKEFMRSDGRSLLTPFAWGVMVATQERPLAMLRMKSQAKQTDRALRTLPLGAADQAAMRARSQYIQDVLRHPAEDPHWDRLDHRHRVAEVSVPVSSVGGWHDIFLPGQLRDFEALQKAGKPARLTVGPWTHDQALPDLLTHTLEFGLPLARGEEPADRAPVRLYVMGDEAWRDFDSWPPEGYAPQRFHLGADQALSTAVPDEQGTDRYRYDPADPTPMAGGAIIQGGGRTDNTELEARADVLTYTTAPLGEDVEVIGEVAAEIWFRSSLDFADVFVRLCEVDEEGRSFNICDGLTTIEGAQALQRVTVRLWPTAHRFKRGRRLRVQVSSGSFPRYARQHGTGEPLATAMELKAADQEVHHGPEHPSALILPVGPA